MRLLGILVAVPVLLILGTGVFMRLTPMPAETWHADPDTATAPGTPNYVLLRGDDAPQVVGTVAEVATRLDDFARETGAERIAGDLADGHATYIARTRLMGYPDAVSIRLQPVGEDAVRVAIFSRSRFGQSDMGANRVRVDRWIASLQG